MRILSATGDHRAAVDRRARWKCSGAAGIIYFALPQTGNPGFLVVVAVFIISFSAGSGLQRAGRIGRVRTVFLKSMPGAPHDGVLAALLVFRLLYLLIPLGFAIFIVLGFERRQLAEAIEHHHHKAGEKGDVRTSENPK